MALGVAPLVEERRHIDGEVLDHGEVAERLEPQRAAHASASLTRVRQVQRGRPFTTMAQEPHMPTRQAKRYDSVASCSRWICVTTSRMVWCARRGTVKLWKTPSAAPRQTSTDSVECALNHCHRASWSAKADDPDPTKSRLLDAPPSRMTG